MDAYATNSSGTVLEKSTSETIFLEAGETYALVSTFKKATSSKATNYDYDLVVDTDASSYDVKGASNCIDAKFSDDGKGNVTVTAKNTSKYTVEAEAIVIWYDEDDQIVDFERLYLADDVDNELFPGAKTSQKAITYDS